MASEYIPPPADLPRKKRPPTHVLTITIPIHADDLRDAEAAVDVIRRTLITSRMVLGSCVCDDIDVSYQKAAQ